MKLDGLLRFVAAWFFKFDRLHVFGPVARTVFNQLNSYGLVTTILFLGLLPFSWLWLPVIYLIGSVIVLAGIKSRLYTRLRRVEADLSHHIRGCFIFGAQALMLNLPQHGIRLIIAAFMTVETVAQFTIAYMQSTAVFFVYSAVMITCEAELSRAASITELRARVRQGATYALVFILMAIAFHRDKLINSSGNDFNADAQLDTSHYYFNFDYLQHGGVQSVVNACSCCFSSGTRYWQRA